MTPVTSSVTALERAIGYTFQNPQLAERALCHSSIEVRPSNERLEFLGDRVLALAISTLLYRNDTLTDEGSMAAHLNARVCRDACAAAARAAGLGGLLQLSAGEQRGGGRLKSSILSDAIEAVIGAVYLDGGFPAAEATVLRLWQRVEFAAPARDDKGRLQELAQQRGLPIPHYVLLRRRGPDHAPHFTVEVQLPGLAPAEGTGSSRRDAERAAAAALLLRDFCEPS